MRISTNNLKKKIIKLDKADKYLYDLELNQRYIIK